MAKQVTYTLQPVTINDISQVVFRKGDLAGEIVISAYFNVKDETETVRYVGILTKTISGTPVTNFATYLNANVIPDFNTQEGL